MPTYDYVCTACGHRMEVVHGIHGHGPEACPVCGGAMRKAMVAPAVHFKGSGWAKKDRGAAASTKAAAKAAAGDSDGATKKADSTASEGSTTPSGDKPSGDKPSGDKPSGDKPSGDKPSGDQKAAGADATAPAAKTGTD